MCAHRRCCVCVCCYTIVCCRVQVMGAMCGACRRAVLEADPRLVEALYLCQVQAAAEALSGVYAVLGRRRARVLQVRTLAAPDALTTRRRSWGWAAGTLPQACVLPLRSGWSSAGAPVCLWLPVSLQLLTAGCVLPHVCVLQEELREGSGAFLVHAYLPVEASFGLADEMRRRSSGAASASLLLSHWERLQVSRQAWGRGA